MSDSVPQSAEQITSNEEMMVRQWLAEISQLNEQMAFDQERIVRLKIETDALRGETDRLRAETRAALARMGESL